MNVPATLPQLPAHLAKLSQNTALMGMNQAASAGISQGAWPSISIKGGYWRLNVPGQDEVVAPDRHLDVIIVDANPNGVSKVYYDTKWNPDSVAAPTCYSDNGVGPSSKAQHPQSPTCAACPHNVWGSKISEVSGKQIKACSDVKRVAVLCAGNPDGPVFSLAVPADSLKNFVTYVTSLDKHGIPACTVVTRLTFDTSVSHQRIVFAPAWRDGQMPYIDEAQAQAVEEVYGTAEVDLCTGKNDVPVNPALVKALPAPHVAQPNHTEMPPQRVATPVATVGPTPPHNPAFPHAGLPPRNAPAPSSAPAAVAGTPPPAAGVEAPKRTRTRKAAEPAQATLLPPGAGMPPTQNAANTTTPMAPQGVTSASLDALIRQATSPQGLQEQVNKAMAV